MRYGTGVALVVVAALMWSSMSLAIRLIEAADTWQVLFWRSAGMVPVLVGIILLRSGGLWGPLCAVGLAGVIAGAGLVAAFAGAIYAIQTTTVANAVFLYAASPFLAAVFGWLILREPVAPATWAAIALAGVGIFLMVREGLSLGMGAGSAAALLSAAGFAAFTLALRWGKLGDMYPALLIGALMSMTVAAAVTLGAGGTLAVPLRDAGLALAAGAVLLGMGLALYTLGSRAVPAAELTLLAMIEVMLAPVWVWLVVGETASPGTWIGGAVLLAAVAGNALAGLRRGAPA
jgi:DME family drug/metabolite transporter